MPGGGHGGAGEGAQVDERLFDPARGPVQRLDPAVRLAGALVLSLAVALSGRFATLGAALAFGVGLALLARLPWEWLFRRWLALNGFLLIFLLWLPFTHGSSAIGSLGGAAVYGEGLREALRLALRANAILLLACSLAGTLGPAGLAHALRALRAPRRLAHLVFFTLRYIGLLEEDAARLRQAMRARGFRPRLTRHALRSLGYFVGMLLVRSLERAERSLEAMRCRGFNGELRFPAPAGQTGGQGSSRRAAAGIALALLLFVFLEVR